MINNLNENITELNHLRHKQENEQSWLNTLTHNAQGQIKKTSTLNVTKIFANDENLSKLLRINDFTDRIELYKNLQALKLRKKDLKRVEIQVRNYIEQNYHVCFDDNYLHPGMMSYLYSQSYDHEYNPIKDRIRSVEWDGKERAATYFIDYLGAADTPLNREITKKWLIGAVGRPFKPGLKVDLMPILVGEQGKGKSTICKALCPKNEDGNYEYFNDNLTSLSSDNKDDIQRVHTNWIIEVAELQSFNNSNIEKTKSFISQEDDDTRNPYDRLTERKLRTNVFIGTTNSEDFLKDRTGNRRFLPIKVGVQPPKKDFKHIDDDYIKQVLAEAYYYYTQGEKPVLSDDMQDTLRLVQNEYMTVDIEEEEIKTFANMLVPTDWNKYNYDDKLTYYNHVMNRNKYIDRHQNELDPAQLIKMPSFTSVEIAKIVLESSNSRGIGRKIAAIMQSIPEFRKGYVHRTRGYIRKENN